MFFLFHRDEFPVLGDASSKFLVLFKKSRHVFVNTPSDHDPGLSPIFPQRINLDFNSMTVKMLAIWVLPPMKS